MNFDSPSQLPPRIQAKTLKFYKACERLCKNNSAAKKILQDINQQSLTALLTNLTMILTKIGRYLSEEDRRTAYNAIGRIETTLTMIRDGVQGKNTEDEYELRTLLCDCRLLLYNFIPSNDFKRNFGLNKVRTGEEIDVDIGGNIITQNKKDDTSKQEKISILSNIIRDSSIITDEIVKLEGQLVINAFDNANQLRNDVLCHLIKSSCSNVQKMSTCLIKTIEVHNICLLNNVPKTREDIEEQCLDLVASLDKNHRTDELTNDIRLKIVRIHMKYREVISNSMENILSEYQRLAT